MKIISSALLKDGFSIWFLNNCRCAGFPGEMLWQWSVFQAWLLSPSNITKQKAKQSGDCRGVPSNNPPCSPWATADMAACPAQRVKPRGIFRPSGLRASKIPPESPQPRMCKDWFPKGNDVVLLTSYPLPTCSVCKDWFRMYFRNESQKHALQPEPSDSPLWEAVFTQQSLCLQWDCALDH